MPAALEESASRDDAIRTPRDAKHCLEHAFVPKSCLVLSCQAAGLPLRLVRNFLFTRGPSYWTSVRINLVMPPTRLRNVARCQPREPQFGGHSVDGALGAARAGSPGSRLPGSGVEPPAAKQSLRSPVSRYFLPNNNSPAPPKNFGVPRRSLARQVFSASPCQTVTLLLLYAS